MVGMQTNIHKYVHKASWKQIKLARVCYGASCISRKEIIKDEIQFWIMAL